MKARNLYILYKKHEKVIRLLKSKNLLRPYVMHAELVRAGGPEVSEFISQRQFQNAVVLDGLKVDACYSNCIDPNHECAFWSCTACQMDVLYNFFNSQVKYE